MEQSQRDILFQQLLNEKKEVIISGPTIHLNSCLPVTSGEEKWLNIIIIAVNVMKITSKPVKIITEVEENVTKILRKETLEKDILSYICQTLENIQRESIEPDGNKGFKVFTNYDQITKNLVVTIRP